MEDARAKLNHDLKFPPGGAKGQETFTYSEDVSDFDGRLVGEYTVTLDLTFRHEPYRLVTIHSTGRIGGRQDPVATRSFQAEWSGRDRTSPPVEAGSLCNFVDLGT